MTEPGEDRIGVGREVGRGRGPDRSLDPQEVTVPSPREPIVEQRRAEPPGRGPGAGRPLEPARERPDPREVVHRRSVPEARLPDLDAATRLTSMTDREPPGECCFDEWAAHSAKRARSKETVAPITTALLAALDAAGLEGRTIVDVGCGTGDLALAALAHGASRAVGFDLGTGSIAHARELASERGLEERSAFEVADGSVATLPRTDV